MKMKRTLGITMVALAFMLVVGVGAKAKDSRDVVLFHDASLAGTHLASGRYHVNWETHSPEATVTFQQGKKVLATADGKVADRGKKYGSNEVVYTENPNGSRVIQEIRFAGSSEVIVFNE